MHDIDVIHFAISYAFNSKRSDLAIIISAKHTYNQKIEVGIFTKHGQF